MFLTLQTLSMNNPWMEWLREKIVPVNYGFHDFVFGTCEERRAYATYNSASKDKWFTYAPEWCIPTPDDDRGLFTAEAPTAAQGWRSAAAAQFKQAAELAMAKKQ